MLSNELETHFLAELDRLYKLSSGPERQRIRASFNMNSGMHMNNGLIQGPDSRWEVRYKIILNEVNFFVCELFVRTEIFH